MARNRSEKVSDHIFQTDALTLLLYAADIKDGRLVGLVGKGMAGLTLAQEAADNAIGEREREISRGDMESFEATIDALPFNDGRNAVADFIIERHKEMVFGLMYWAHAVESGDGYHRLNAALSSMSRAHQNTFTAWPQSTKSSLGKRLLAYARAASRDYTDAIFPNPLV